MKTLACLTLLLFTSIQFRAEEITVCGRDWNLNFLIYTKFIYADSSSEKVEDKGPIAWIGSQSRNFVFSVFEKQLFLTFILLVDEEFFHFFDWLPLPRKPPDA